MRALLAVAAFAALGCSSPETTSTTVQSVGTCGRGTHLESGVCTADRFTMVVARHLEANAKPTSVLVFGRMPDGSPSTEQVVLGTSRPGAGLFDDPVVALAPEGSRRRFTPCAASIPGCVGALQLTLALASDPATVLARVDLELGTTPAVASVEPCSGGGNVIYMESDDLVYPGALTVVDGAFTLTGDPQRAILDVVPTDPVQGKHWTFDFSAVPLGTQLSPGVYRPVNAGSGTADMTVGGQTPYDYCSFTYPGEFQIHAYTPSTALTASFRRTCHTKVVHGCVHFE